MAALMGFAARHGAIAVNPVCAVGRIEARLAVLLVR
jgi:hypothetical protein